MAFNTGNPVGSTDARDLLDNAQNLDTALQTEQTTFVDRLGRTRVSWEGAIKYSVLSETYSAGLEVTTRNQIIFSAGEWWAISGSTSLPYTTTGAGMPEGGAFQSVGDAKLRGELVQPVATFDSVADMVNATGLTVGGKAKTLGYYTPGDGGGNDYEIVAAGAGTDDGGSYIDLSGSGLQAKALFSVALVNVKQFGVTGDGSTDDTVQLQAAIDYSTSNGGGIVSMPKGTYVVSDPNADAGSFQVKSQVQLIGSGIDSTIIFLADNSNANILNIEAGGSDIRVSGLTIDGNRLNQSAGHTVRAAGVTNLFLDHLKLVNSYFYGIGIQGGTNQNVFIDHVLIEDCGADGIDIKNYNDQNSEIYITNTVVNRHARDLSLSVQAGIDCRGIITIDNVSVLNVRDNAHGIRFREGDPTDKVTYPAGAGGRFSRLSNFRISSDGNPGHVSSSGIYIADPQITVSNGRVSGLNRNIETGVLAEGISISNVYSRLANTSCYYIGSPNTYLSNCIGTTAQDTLRVRASDTRFSNCEFVGATRYGASIDASLSGVRFTSCEFNGTTANVLNNSVSGVVFSNTIGTFTSQQNNEPWPYGTTANRPSSPVTGQRFYDTTILKPIWFDGTNWRDAASTVV